MSGGYFFFFFSSRRRHTRFDCDWSSDVCSSDLEALVAGLRDQDPRTLRLALSIAVALQAWPDTAVPLLVNRATDRTLAGDLRALAVRCLGYTKASAALETLLQLTAGGRPLFGRGEPAGQAPPLLLP